MPNTINKGQSGVSKFANKMFSEWKKTGSELRDIVSGKPSKPSEAGKARGESTQVRARNSVESLERMYENKPKGHACNDSIQDHVAFSPEALAMMGA